MYPVGYPIRFIIVLFQKDAAAVLQNLKNHNPFSYNLIKSHFSSEKQRTIKYLCYDLLQFLNSC